uniref:Integrase, catalytic region, zinc finger, CCHC-type, peptidase aspartic, catalytic n=1 Tax=Tanacetum cinerariifolium TaxID=118510 RepID=A0A6L2LJH4_TANCI|nr:hypothetical protein [Tanacetum cinerariifolium]
MELYMLNRQHGRMILESVESGPLLWPTIEENGVTRLKKYSELSTTEAIQADCNVKATNIILQGLPSKVYALRECKLYDEFDKFAYRKGESLRDYYLRFSLLLNDMNIYNMKLEQFQVNMKFLNTLPPEWSKFVTDVKLVLDLHTTNVDQLHAYLGQHEYHANEVQLMHERTSDPLALVAHHQMNKSTYQQHQQSYHQHQLQPQASTYQSSPYGTHYHSFQYKSQAPSSTHLLLTYPSNDYQSSVNHNVTLQQITSSELRQTLVNKPPSTMEGGERLCWGRWVEVVGVVWRWWSGVEWRELVGKLLAGKPVDEFVDEEADMQREVEEILKSVHDAHRGPDGSNPGDDTGPQPQSSHVVHDGPNLEHMNLEATDVSTQQNPEQIDKGFTATAYPNIQENLKLTVEEQVILEEPASSTGTLSSLQHLAKDFSFGDQFFNDIPSEAENEKTTAETEAESIPLQATATETTTTTTTTTHPPPPQPQQSTTDSILTKHISELEQIMANLIQDNKHLKESQSDQSKSTAAPSSSKTAASAKFTAWTTTNTRLRSSVSLILEDLHMDDDVALDEKVHSSDDEDIGNAHIPKMWIEEECKYNIAAMYGISHWWFQRQRFYIDRHTSKGDHRAVRTHMWILSVVRIEVFSMYGYDYMKTIVLRRADLNEHIISKRDFKYLYPSDFKDLYLLNLQGHINHLPPKDRKILTTVVNLWTRHLVIRQRVKDFQLGIKSYQTQLNLTKPRWDATGFEYKHDFTVTDSPRAVTFRDKYEVEGEYCNISLSACIIQTHFLPNFPHLNQLRSQISTGLKFLIRGENVLSLLFSEDGVLHVNWISYGHFIASRVDRLILGEELLMVVGEEIEELSAFENGCRVKKCVELSGREHCNQFTCDAILEGDC